MNNSNGDEDLVYVRCLNGELKLLGNGLPMAKSARK